MEILLKQKKLGRAKAPSRICGSSLASVVLSAYFGVIETAVELVRHGSSSHSEHSINSEGKKKHTFVRRVLWGVCFFGRDCRACSSMMLGQRPPVST